MAKLRYFPKKHVYYYGRKKLESVTTFVGRFFKPFNAREIARKLAKFKANKDKKHGVKYFLKEWKESADHGTRVHQLLEGYIKFKVVPEDVQECDLPKFEQGIYWVNKNLEVNSRVQPEVKVFDETLGLAGTIDLVITNNDGTVTLVDWKTNRDIKTKGYNGEKAKEPLEMDDCSYNKYNLQLSTYAYILEHKYNTQVKDLILVHLLEDNHGEYQLPYLKEEVKKMLEVKE